MTTHRLAVFGNPISHSRSPEIHLQFAKQHGLSVDYERLLVPVDDFHRYASNFLAEGGRGFNVTVPFKQDAFRFVTLASHAANVAQSVNTVSVSDEGTVAGDNTDGAGLVADLIENLGWSLREKKILVLGAGGAVRGVLTSMLACNPKRIHIFNRTRQRAEEVVKHFSDARPDVPLTTADATTAGAPFDVIINGTSAGLKGMVPELPGGAVGPETQCYDMSYGSSETPFLAWARQSGAGSCADGLGMLVEQAARSFEIWFDCTVSTLPVIQQMRMNL